MGDITTYVGMDVYQKVVHVAMLVGAQRTALSGQLSHEPKAVRTLVRKLEREAPGPITCCYEAGPCGYALQRQLTTARIRCAVIAPALVPRKPGDRVKTDRRDARKLAELWRAGLLTEVHPPTAAEEAVRDLCRARDDARRSDAQSASPEQVAAAPGPVLSRPRVDAGPSHVAAHRVWGVPDGRDRAG